MKALKVLFTNWINILGVFVVVCIYGITHSDDLSLVKDISELIPASLFIAYLIFVGILFSKIFWIGLLFPLVLLDLILIIPNIKSLRIVLIIEWVIISILFILFMYWQAGFEEKRPLDSIVTDTALVTTFLITQMIREKLIIKINAMNK